MYQEDKKKYVNVFSCYNIQVLQRTLLILTVTNHLEILALVMTTFAHRTPAHVSPVHCDAFDVPFGDSFVLRVKVGQSRRFG